MLASDLSNSSGAPLVVSALLVLVTACVVGLLDDSKLLGRNCGIVGSYDTWEDVELCVEEDDEWELS